ncbi:MAG: type II toxin-antitoxin system PrlF family antitoxin [Bryobacteraceae bacterium]
MTTSTLTSKGQLTIPKEVRDQLQLKAGQKIEFRVVSDGQVLMRARNRNVTALKGVIKPKPGKHVSIQQMNESIADGYASLGKGRA